MPVQITFRDMPASEAVQQRILKKAEGLERYYERIVGCRVMVEESGKHRRNGRLFHVRVDLTVPGGELVVNRDPPRNQGHEDVYVAIRDAFDAARRQLEDFAQRQRREQKVHVAPPHGLVTQLEPQEGYGFIRSEDGIEVYFHRNALGDGAFERLEVGQQVRFALHEDETRDGPQASSVTPIGKHHLS
jgi:ribosomal subunit interface protein